MELLFSISFIISYLFDKIFITKNALQINEY